jgi:N-acetylmuramoyl-L-alanine amidase
VGGAPLSQHKEFTALDIAFDGVTPERVYERLIEWRKAGKFVGGLGLYPSSGFVHIDTRGRNSTWKGK